MARRSIKICLDRTNEDLCDLEIISGNGTGEDNGDEDGETGGASPILATKVFLYGISDKWKELIQSARKTLTKDADSVRGKIFIPRIQRDIMENIIDFVYAGLRNEIQPLPLDDQNVGKYFAAAKFLEMEDIEEKCLSYFDSKTITLENFSVLFKWWSTFGIEAIRPKMRAFLTQHSQQVPEIIRRCKNELNFPESEIALILICWLSACLREREKFDLDVKQMIRQFSDKNEKIRLIDALFEADDSDWSKTAFKLLRNLYKNGDSDSEDMQGAGRKSTTVPPPAKSKSKSTASSFSSASSKTISTQSGTTSNSNSSSSGPQPTSMPTPTTSKSSAPPTKKLRTKNNSTRSNLNSAVVELDRLDSPEQEQEKEDETHIQNKSVRGDSSSSSNASETQKKRTFDKNSKPAQDSSAKGVVYFLLKNQKSPGGFYFWSFNLKTHKTGQGAQLPPSFQDRQKLAMVYWKNTIYFMGGESSQTGKITKEVYAFDLKSGEWTKVDMIDPRCDFGACVLNGNIYAVGGCEESPDGPEEIGEGISTAEILSLASRKRAAQDQIKWEQVDCMENCRAHAGIVALGGKIYAIGGEVGNDFVGLEIRARNLCEVFDPKNRLPQNQWNPIAPMKHKRLGLAAFSTTEPHPNRIYALGGTLRSPSATNSPALNTVEIYNLDEESWESGPPMKKPRKFFSAVYANNCIYALGGDSETQPTMEKFDLKTKKWTLEGDLKKEGNFVTVAFESL